MYHKNQNKSINLNYTFSEGIEIPIFYYSDRTDIKCNLILKQPSILREIGDTQILSDKVGTRNICLDLQPDKTKDYYIFAKVLTKKTLPKYGIYTGYIEVRTKGSFKDNPYGKILDFIPVYISLQPNPLILKSEFMDTKDNHKNITIKDMIAEIYGTLKITPHGMTKHNNVLYDAGKRYVQVFKGQNNSYMPHGSLAFLMDDENRMVQKYWGVPLYNTNHKGQELDTLEQITDDGLPGSYVVFDCLPKGRYGVYAEAVVDSVKIKTEIQSFLIQ